MNEELYHCHWVTNISLKTTILLTVTGCLLSGGMSMRIATKAFSYSFNVFHMSHSSMDGGGGKISD